jgi:hypothetical protein
MKKKNSSPAPARMAADWAPWESKRVAFEISPPGTVAELTRALAQKRKLQFAIEQGIPIPKKGQTQWCGISLAIAKLKVGDSFLVPPDCHPVQMYGSCYNAAKRLGYKIVTRKISGTGWRIWRTA